ncbi:MAG TPA: type II toxin-antitoxin system PemK/MazF family toxin [Patescibacteria group bacterium]|nr:type II toxin-antitoxin system PemK/MazF family toxin [Patescibacteria group bacterium]
MRKRKQNPKRGEIFLVNFDPTIGSEIKKTRPALVIQNDISNAYSPVVIVAAITSRNADKIYPTEVKLTELPKTSIVLLNQIRTIDKSRLVKRLAKVSPSTMVKVDSALKISLALIDL